MGMFHDQESHDNRRRAERLALHLKVRIQGIDHFDKPFQEAASMYDLSGTGAQLCLSKDLILRNRSILDITVLLPPTRQQYSMQAQARVTRIHAQKDSQEQIIGIQFITPLSFQSDDDHA